MFRKLTTHFVRRRFAVLFFSLLFTMVAGPVFGAMRQSTRFMEVFLGLNILTLVLITLFDFGMRLSLWLLALVMIMRGAHIFMGGEPFLATSQGVTAAICLLSGYVLLRFVLSEGMVTTERIFAGLDVYLLIGITCGLFFCMLEQEWPGSFSFQGSSIQGSSRNTLAHTIYFSFVTLGTLGYGDVIPISGPARALAVSEAIVGQMYLVVVVARLVSLYQGGGARIDHRNDKEPNPPDTIQQV